MHKYYTKYEVLTRHLKRLRDGNFGARIQSFQKVGHFVLVDSRFDKVEDSLGIRQACPSATAEEAIKTIWFCRDIAKLRMKVSKYQNLIYFQHSPSTKR